MNQAGKEENRLCKVLEKRNVYLNDLYSNNNTNKNNAHTDVNALPDLGHLTQALNDQQENSHLLIKNVNSQSEVSGESTGEYYNSNAKLSLMNNIQFSSTDSISAHMHSNQQENSKSYLKRLPKNATGVKRISDRDESADNTDSESKHLLINKQLDDYDNRPIKPLDPDLLNKQLSGYSEMSSEEYEQLRIKYKF